MINKIIADYLSSGRRMVLPEFGAFLRKDDTGEVVFVEFLKKDDGVLTGLVREKLAVTQTEATEVVGTYIMDIRRKVQDSGAYAIEGVGTLHLDANGNYALSYDPSVQPEAAVAEPVASKPEPARPLFTDMPALAAEPMPAPGEKISRKTIPALPPKGTRKRADVVMMIAIVAALVALAVMVYSMWATQPPKIDLIDSSPTAPTEVVE